VKLNIGCGIQQSDGWTNIDIDEDLQPDIIDDASTLSKFSDESVNEIKTQHLFEHLMYGEALSALKNWFRVLKDGGILSIECPDFDKCHKLINSEDLEGRRFGYMGLFGFAYTTKNPPNNMIHKCAWNFKLLKEELKKISFVNIREAEIEQTFRCCNGKYERDMRILAEKRK